MVSRSSHLVLVLSAACGLYGSRATHAQDALPPAVSAPAIPSPPPAKRVVRKMKPAKTAIKTPAKPVAQAPAPWAAVDPDRAVGAGAPPSPVDPNAAAVPGIHHVVQPDQDAVSYGMKWNSSNATASQYSTQGVVNEVNHDLGAPNALGTDAEVGLKLHF